MNFGPCVAIGLAAGLAFFPGTANAQRFYNNWNTAACGFTHNAGFNLRKSMHLTSIELWYHWGPRERDVRYELYQNDKFVKRGRLRRGNCDPYQQAWCEARDDIGIDLPRGFVEVRTERPNVCQNEGSNGEGFIHVYGFPTGHHGRD